MKTIRRYEPSDIDLHSPRATFVLSAIILGGLIAKAKPSESNEDAARRVVAEVLNLAIDCGVSISTSEVPAVIREAFGE
jgi:hypothetical protein